MFDYEAGEKYKLTLIMVGVAGALAGMFFTMLLAPSPEPPSRRQRQMARHMTDPDVTGGYRAPSGIAANAAQSGPPGSAPPNILAVDPINARTMMDTFLPCAWDLSAGTARESQQRALAYMTPECAQAYRQNIWTDAIAQKIDQSGVQSHFAPEGIDVGTLQSDGTLVVTVQGTQTLTVPGGQGGKSRRVKVEYLMKQFPEGLKIAGISEAKS